MINYNSLPDKILVKKIQKEENNDALKELIIRHTPICYHVFQRYAGIVHERGGSVRDLYDEKDLLIYNSAKTYKPQKRCKFSSHLRNMARFRCLNFLNKDMITVSRISLDELVEHPSENQKNIFFQNDFTLRDIILKHLGGLDDKRIKQIFELRYFSGEKKSWREVGDGIGYCYETVRSLHNKYLGFLKEKILINKQKEFFFEQEN